MKFLYRLPFFVLCVTFCLMRPFPGGQGYAAEITIERNDEKHQLDVLIDTKRILGYRYSADHFLPYFFPVRSPSGKDLTVKSANPYPHHCSFWIADKVQLDGRPTADFYNAYYKRGKGPGIRHQRFLEAAASKEHAGIRMELIWELGSEIPVLKETRSVKIVPLEDGEYLMDLCFIIEAAFGAVHFVSDPIHYAWPYIRIHPRFSVKKGGKIVNSEGGVNRKGTNNKIATWCDYSNTVEGKTEGLAIFSHTDNAHPHRWLTRDYGTFGPRRIDERNGKRFTLKKGESLKRRVGILVHNGDVVQGKVAERYEQYVKGTLQPSEE